MAGICSCFGHSEIIVTEVLSTKLFKVISDLIKKGITIFYFGGFSGFDNLCHQVVSTLKLQHSNIKRIYCLSDPRHTRISKRPIWLKDEDYEEFIYLDLKFDYWYKRIYFRNCEMINNSDFVIFYVEKTENSGAYKAMQYTMKKKKEFVNLGTIKKKP